jgi:hypothetical protein
VQDGLTTAINLARRFFAALSGMRWTLVSLIARSDFDFDVRALHPDGIA